MRILASSTSGYITSSKLATFKELVYIWDPNNISPVRYSVHVIIITHG